MTLRRRWELGATAALLLVLALVGGWFFYRTQLDSALVKAVASSNLVGTRALLDRGADPNTRDKPSDDAPVLMIAATRSNPQLVTLLLDRGAKVDASAKGGDTALIEAAGTGDVSTTPLLLDRGADVNAVDSSGLTPLLSAAWRCRPEVVRLLLRRGADPTVNSKLGNATRMAKRGLRLPSMTLRCGETLAVLAKETPRK